MTHNKVIIGILIVIASIFGVLAFGNPQWHKQVYMFQTYVWPEKRPKIPSMYTGVWKNWKRDGTLKYSREYVDGEVHGMAMGLESMNGVKYWFEGLVKEGDPIIALAYDPEDRNQLLAIYRYGIDRAVTPDCVYDPFRRIDRRAEFGIEIE